MVAVVAIPVVTRSVSKSFQDENIMRTFAVDVKRLVSSDARCDSASKLQPMLSHERRALSPTRLC
jgi:hypothetical protein